jgi:hypothetical protein
VAHDCGHMNQQSMIVPATRRQELQWSKEIAGMCLLTSCWGPIGSSGSLSMIGREAKAGTEIV